MAVTHFYGPQQTATFTGPEFSIPIAGIFGTTQLKTGKIQWPVEIGVRYGGQQLSCIGVDGRVKQGFARRYFDNAA